VLNYSLEVIKFIVEDKLLGMQILFKICGIFHSKFAAFWCVHEVLSIYFAFCFCYAGYVHLLLGY